MYGAQGGLPAEPDQDETPLSKALLALAERFERSEKRNAAIASLAERMKAGDLEGKRVWLRVIEAIKEPSSPSPGSTRH